MDLLDSAKATASLAPGFRFHPTDEELVRYYLRRKLCGKPFRFDAISEIDIYKVEPWDLPGKSKLKSRDLEWYFFSVLDKKYGNGSRTNRATDRGYWKTTGKDRAVYHRTRTVGMKKTLVYHNGRAPTGQRTNWVMHEYRLIDEEMEKAGISQDAFVLCRIFQKSGSGPKNGEQYGAPLIEEEWDDFELDIVPKDEHTRELAVCDDAYLDEHDLEQILGAVDPLHDASIAVNSSIRDENGYVEEHRNFNDNAQGTSVVVDENKFVQVQPDDRALFNLPVQDSMEAKSVNDEYIGNPGYRGESSNTMNPLDVDYMLDLPFLDAIDDLPSGDMSFIETNDLQQPVDSDSSSYDLINEYLQFFDATDDNLQNIGFEYSDMMHSEELSSDPALFLPYKDASVGTEQEAGYGKQLSQGISHDPATSLKQAQTKQSDYQYQFIKQASNMLGDVSAPPALASEFPTKDAALRLSSAYASSARVSAGILQIRKVTFGGLGKKWSNGEHDLANTILSFGLSRGDSNSADSQLSSGLSEKANSTVSRGWFYFMFMWVLFLSTSVKIGAYILAK